MATPYEVAFKYEILNEFIAHVDAMIGREFRGELPSDIAPLSEEVWEIYRNVQVERDIEVLDKYDKRLIEIRDYVQARETPPVLLTSDRRTLKIIESNT